MIGVTSRPSLRWSPVRTGLVASVLSWVSVACHVMGGGMRPPVSAALGVLVLTLAAAAWLGRRRLSVARVTVVVSGLEILTHLLCSLPEGTGTAMPLDERMAMAHVVAGILGVALLCGADGFVVAVATTLAARVGRALGSLTVEPLGGRTVVRVAAGGVVPLRSQAPHDRRGIRGPPR